MAVYVPPPAAYDWLGRLLEAEARRRLSPLFWFDVQRGRWVRDEPTQ